MKAQRGLGRSGRPARSGGSGRWRVVAVAVALAAVGGMGGVGCGDTTDAAAPADGPLAPTTSSSEPSNTPSTAPVPAPGDSSAAPGGPPPCPPSGLVVTLGVEDGALGRRFTTLRLTNCGSAPDEVNGYPEITLLDAEQQPLDVTVVHGTDFVEASGPQPLVLAPGDAPRVIATQVDPGTSGEVEVTAWQPIPPPWSQ